MYHNKGIFNEKLSKHIFQYVQEETFYFILLLTFYLRFSIHICHIFEKT